MRHLMRALGTAALACGLCIGASADTLQMKNGTVVQGKFLGGSERAVQFDVNGKINLYNVDEILSITFTGAPAPTTSQPVNPLQNPKPIAAENDRQPADRPFDRPGDRPDDRTIRAADHPESLPHRPAAPREAEGALPAGTHILVRMIDSVDSAKNRVGDIFHASLESDLMAGDTVIAARGSDVYGRLSDAAEAGHLTGKSQLKLELTDISIYNKRQPIVTGDYEVSGDARGSNTAKKVGGGAIVGAVIGAIAGGGKGAAIGAGVGAGAGAAVNVVTRGEEVKVPSETVLDFRLEQPFTPELP
jgi:hypothetical protein